ncbi:MAG: hypothetical protein AB7T48_06005 [Solirubrobacterales bacterium]
MAKKAIDNGPVKDEDLIPIASGQPISEKLAEEAERGYADIDKWHHEYRGRPSLSGNGTSPKMSFRITPELYLALERKAVEEEKTVSQATREAIARYVES